MKLPWSSSDRRRGREASGRLLPRPRGEEESFGMLAGPFPLLLQLRQVPLVLRVQRHFHFDSFNVVDVLRFFS